MRSLRYHYEGLDSLSERIRSQKLSPVKVVTACLERIERLNPTLNAFITVTDDGQQALVEAAKAEEELKDHRWRGPLHGIPVGVKDMFDTAGVRTTAAFERFRDRVPTKDAEAVTRLKDVGGAIVIGKTNMHELAMGTTSVVSYFGPVHNPWNEDYVAGGSSGGSAAAVAAGMCFATLDTDAIGSCRLPAACCGVTGLKPTFGLISNRGVLEGEPVDEAILKLAHAAITTRTVQDSAMVLNALTTPGVSRGAFATDYTAAFGAIEVPRVGVAANFKATKEVRKIFEKAVDELHSLGCTTTEVDAPLDSPGFDVSHVDTDRRTISKKSFKNIDVLVLPTLTDKTPTIKAANASGPQTISPENTLFCDYYGLPAISVPCGFDKNGLPMGLQIVGPWWGEGAVLDVANRYQQATKWHLKHPLK